MEILLLVVESYQDDTIAVATAFGEKVSDKIGYSQPHMWHYRVLLDRGIDQSTFAPPHWPTVEIIEIWHENSLYPFPRTCPIKIPK